MKNTKAGRTTTIPFAEPLRRLYQLQANVRFPSSAIVGAAEKEHFRNVGALPFLAKPSSAALAHPSFAPAEA